MPCDSQTVSMLSTGFELCVSSSDGRPAVLLLKRIEILVTIEALVGVLVIEAAV